LTLLFLGTAVTPELRLRENEVVVINFKNGKTDDTFTHEPKNSTNITPACWLSTSEEEPTG
jgi:hypothetical protein